MTLTRAKSFCMVRGYIARDSKPDQKFWKNSSDFDTKLKLLTNEDYFASDWSTHDPEGEEYSLTA